MLLVFNGLIEFNIVTWKGVTGRNSLAYINLSDVVLMSFLVHNKHQQDTWMVNYQDIIVDDFIVKVFVSHSVSSTPG